MDDMKRHKINGLGSKEIEVDKKMRLLFIILFLKQPPHKWKGGQYTKGIQKLKTKDEFQVYEAFGLLIFYRVKKQLK